MRPSSGGNTRMSRSYHGRVVLKRTLRIGARRNAAHVEPFAWPRVEARGGDVRGSPIQCKTRRVRGIQNAKV